MSVETSQGKAGRAKAATKQGMQKHTQNKPSTKGFLRWKRVGAFFLFVLFLLVCVGFYLWINRYSLMERYAQSVLHEQGIIAEISIESFSREMVVLNDVSLTYQSETTPFFSAQRVEADFILKEALNGKMKRLRFVEPQARITLDESFRIIDGWVPPKSNDNPQGLSVPEDGFFLEDASFNLITPYGNPNIAVTAAIRQTDEFEATLIIEPTALNYKDWGLQGSARLDLSVMGVAKNVEALMQIDDLTGEALSLNDATLNVDGVILAKTDLPINLDEMDIDFTGNIEGRAERLGTKHFTLEGSRLDWDGNILREALVDIPLSLNGHIELGADQFALTEASRATDLAETLSLSDALSKTPIAQHFSPSMTKVLEQVLQKSTLQTSADIRLNAEGASVSLREPLIAKRENKRLTLTSLAGTSIYTWDRVSGNLALALDAKMNVPVPLKMTSTYIEAQSFNGWQLESVESFKANIESASAWRVISDQEATRLAPFKAQLNYDARERNRVLKVQGGLDFDGRLPFGVVKEMKTTGEAIVRLAPKGQSGLSLSYTPSTPIMTIASLETTTDWRLEDIELNLGTSKDVFENKDDRAQVNAAVTDVSFIALNLVDNRNMQVRASTANIAGVLDFAEDIKDWQVDFTQADMLSDTMPMEGTDVDVPKGTLKVQQSGEDITFDFTTESLNARVPQGSVTGIKISALGRADAYEVTHSGGVFTAARGDVPQWPVSGTVKFENDVFVGQAQATIPKTNSTPVLVDYTMKDGVTEAKLRLQSMKFAPGRLQPQTLIPAMAGKIAAVEGEVSAAFDLRYQTGQPLISSGVLNVINMDFGTAPGPVTGLKTDIQFSSLFPVQTAGQQTLTLESFDPGLPMENGIVEYSLLPEGIKINSAVWPIGTVGTFALDPFIWRYGADENRVVMRMNEIPIQEILSSAGNSSLEATGTLKGEFPIVVRGLNVLVDKGYVEAKDGGVIRYGTNDGASKAYSQEEALDIIRRQDTPQYSALARDALREFNYRALRASIDGPLDGDVQLGVIFDGTNKMSKASYLISCAVSIPTHRLNQSFCAKV